MIAVLLLSATLGCAAWLYGATEPWAWRVCQALAALCLAATLAEARRRRELDPDTAACVWQWHWGLPLLLLAGFMLAQAANPSHAYSPDDEGLSSLSHIAWLPRSVSRAVTLEAAARLLTCAVVMLAARCACGSRRASKALLGVLVALAASMAVLVILQRAEAPHAPYGVRHHVTGMFANSSNYAAYANLMLPLALSLGRAVQVRAEQRGDRSHPGYLLYVAAAVLLVSNLISGSRAGAAIAVGLAAAWAVLEAVQGRRLGVPARAAAAAALPLVLAGVLFVALRADRLGKVDLPFAEGLSGLAGRVAALTGTARMWGDRWAAGTGAGTFACAFPYYQPPALTGMYFRYAHNDWLEYPAELGVIGAALLAWLIGAVLWPVRGGQEGGAPSASDGRGRHRRSTWRRYERRGIALALAGMSAHALVDFPFHIPATLLTASALAGLMGRRDPTG